MTSHFNTYSGASYILKGFSLCLTPGIRRFVILPLIINLSLMVALISLLISKLDAWISALLANLPSWLAWLSYLLWPLFIAIVLIFCSYFFSTLANWIAAPFNGLLSEHLEAKLTGRHPPNPHWINLIKDLPRIFNREWQKLTYYLPRALGLLLLFWIPIIGQTVAPLLWLVFSIWMLSIQYCDYPFDNHRVTFSNMRSALYKKKTMSFSFGALVMLLTITPIVNLFIIPAAVCGATAMWVDNFSENFSAKS